MAKPLIIPSILVKSRKEAVRRIRRARIAERVQLDISDGRFTPNRTVFPRASWGIPTHLQFEFHLMVKHPETFVHEILKTKHAHTVIFHIEAVHSKRDAIALIEHLRFHGLRVGIALNPETPASAVKPYLARIDHVLVMTVHPGYMGQTFIDMARKIRQIRRWSRRIDIEVDGGIHAGTAGRCRGAGANLFVVGSALYDAPDFRDAYRALQKEVAR